MSFWFLVIVYLKHVRLLAYLYYIGHRYTTIFTKNTKIIIIYNNLYCGIKYTVARFSIIKSRSYYKSPNLTCTKQFISQKTFSLFNLYTIKYCGFLSIRNIIMHIFLLPCIYCLYKELTHHLYFTLEFNRVMYFPGHFKP